MYTPFQGEALLQAYRSSRIIALHNLSAAVPGYLNPDQMLLAYALPTLERLFNASSLGGEKKFRALLDEVSGNIFRQHRQESSNLAGFAKILATLNITEKIKTLDLLHALIAIQLTDIQGSDTKFWLDRLVQRFEVSKKIYESYLPGFRKGEGAKTSVRLYWLFSLALNLFYVKSNEIKYLNTLLKICDLLCSLPKNMLNGHIPENGLSAVLAAEIIGVELLSGKKLGCTYATT